MGERVKDRGRAKALTRQKCKSAVWTIFILYLQATSIQKWEKIGPIPSSISPKNLSSSVSPLRSDLLQWELQCMFAHYLLVAETSQERTVEHLVPWIYISVTNLFTVKAYPLKVLILAHKSQPVESIKVTPNPYWNTKESYDLLEMWCSTPNTLVS